MSHYVNNLLSSVYGEDLLVDEEYSSSEIFASLRTLQSQLSRPDFILTNKEIGRISRQLHAHSHLKYPFTVWTLIFYFHVSILLLLIESIILFFLTTTDRMRWLNWPSPSLLTCITILD